MCQVRVGRHREGIAKFRGTDWAARSHRETSRETSLLPRQEAIELGVFNDRRCQVVGAADYWWNDLDRIENEYRQFLYLIATNPCRGMAAVRDVSKDRLVPYEDWYKGA